MQLQFGSFVGKNCFSSSVAALHDWKPAWKHELSLCCVRRVLCLVFSGNNRSIGPPGPPEENPLKNQLNF